MTLARVTAMLARLVVPALLSLALSGCIVDHLVTPSRPPLGGRAFYAAPYGTSDGVEPPTPVGILSRAPSTGTRFNVYVVTTKP